ncbi:hypothetical protein [Clostridium sp. DJ247]|uniref:hypothetical protein n=1 Tax=Clostridium sp. DJ247 TaxID=2726188 RepID=UPI0016278FB2|nr:hypothetical protein [Clostridium sp. DJ247]MBC2582121.1 hypothetical protein [Clostridium sp. DJ247]
MKIKYKKLILGLALLVIFQFDALGINIPKLTNSNTVYAASTQTDEKVIQQKLTLDINKVWNINFNHDIEVYSAKDYLQVNEVNNGQLGAVVPVTFSQGTKSSILVNPPAGGYKKGQMYQITIKKSIAAKNGKNLFRNNIMKFSINEANTAMAKVEISPVLSMFKAITINATTRSDIKKYKIEGNENLFNIGQTSVNVLNNKSSVQVYFYGNDGYTLLGTTTLNVSTSIADTTLQIR